MAAEPKAENSSLAEVPDRSVTLLFVASFLALFFELVIIRYLSTEIRAFAYLKNLPLIASFLGIGLGMIMARVPGRLRIAFPFVALALFALIRFAGFFHLTHIPMPRTDYVVWGAFPDASRIVVPLKFLGDVLGVLCLIVAFFVVLGGIVGEELAKFEPLAGYGINLAGSFAGVAIFTALGIFSLPPVAWLALGMLCLLPFFRRSKLAVVLLLLTAALTYSRDRNTFWSPYYRIDLHPQVAEGWPTPGAYELEVNHDFHQHILDLSSDFLTRYPGFEPNASARLSYEIPYLVAPRAKDILVVGAGTGNDVAAALRHGCSHVDAVEIDPVILKLGKRFHPEHPYDSRRVTVYNDDARAFFKKAQRRYDLIVFGFLDSHTLVSSYSSVRLDNFVYTRESFQEAVKLLRPGGTLVLAFSAGHSFVPQRMYATLTDAFGKAPSVYDDGYVEGYTFVVASQGTPPPAGLKDIGERFASSSRETVATDDWPFLYLSSRRIPKSIAWIMVLFLIGAFYLVKKTVALPRLANRESLHFFLLGAGFLLLEAKAVTELSLLFGSTWIVNAVVISAFLCMALLANTVAMFWSISRWLAYAVLIALLLVGFFAKYSALNGLASLSKALVAGVIVALPVFFSGLIFSGSFRGVIEPAPALGINLFGAVVGGVLENAVMVSGTASLALLACALYAASAVAMPRRN